MKLMMICTILLPILAGVMIPFLHFNDEDRKKRNAYVAFFVCLTSLCVLALIFGHTGETLTLIALSEQMQIAFRVDGLSCVFLALVAALWPLAVFYAFEYMHHEGKENKFFTFYTITYGVVIGLACSANLITFYLLYECLTFVTLPLVMHAMDRRAIKAGRKYFMYSIAGAAVAFVGMMFLVEYGTSLDFVYGGSLDLIKIGDKTNLVLAGYLLTFFGFGVKAAIFPFHGWLPSAGVAPTPVTALLHAVAVVKAGVFAIARVTFYSFGTAFLAGTWAQQVAISFAIFTIVFGSACAWKEVHLKRRLAYSTISNLSYIVFGITLMTPAGLTGALAHMLFHGIMKICLFFCVGAVMERTHREYVPEIEGFAKVMPVTFGCFTVGAVALSGIPMFAGFISKVSLATAAIQTESVLAWLGVAALLISAVLTAAYGFEISIKAYYVQRGFNAKKLEGISDPSWLMKGPFVILCILMVIFGLVSGPVMDLLGQIAQGLL